METRRNLDTVLDKNTGVLAITNDQLGKLNATVSSVAVPLNDLSTTYARLPDQISEDRVFKSYMANGLGLIAATKLTMGQTEKTMKTVAEEAPLMAKHAESIAGSFDTMGVAATKEANALTAPQTKWSMIKTWIFFVAKLYGTL